MNRFLLLSFFSLSISAMDVVPVDISSKENALTLYAHKKHFYVEDENAAYRVDNHAVNPLLKELIKRNALTKFKDAGYIRINKIEEGKYELAAKVRGEGGGPAGATIGCYIGKFTVHFIAHSTIAVVSAFSGPAAPAVAASLEATFLPAIEAASNVGAIAGGILGAVVTGPA